MQFIQFDTEDGLRLNGILKNVGSDTTIVHIHGKAGNFYENKFVKLMFEFYASAGFNFMSFNNRGHASYAEAYQNGKIAYIGTAVERFEDCLLDLTAAKMFAKNFGSRVIFQGHSFGCEKIMYYSQQIDPTVELILLSPSDGYKLQMVYITPETVEDQISRLKNTYKLEGMEWLAPEEYGIRVEGVNYHVPIIAQALVELMSGPAFEILSLDKSWRGPNITARSYIYLGGCDGLQVDGIEKMVDTLQERFDAATIAVFEDGNHHLKPIETNVMKSIVSWIRG
jgi:pimeloyl-ACP methyl ester carboxylesterase